MKLCSLLFPWDLASIPWMFDITFVYFTSSSLTDSCCCSLLHHIFHQIWSTSTFFVWILCTQKWLNIVHSLTKLRMRKLHEIYHILNASFSHLSFLIEYLLGQNCECTEHWLIKLKYAWIVINFKTTVWKIFSLSSFIVFCGESGRCIDKSFGFLKGKWAWLGNLWIICCQGYCFMNYF